METATKLWHEGKIAGKGIWKNISTLTLTLMNLSIKILLKKLRKTFEKLTNNINLDQSQDLLSLSIKILLVKAMSVILVFIICSRSIY